MDNISIPATTINVNVNLVPCQDGHPVQPTQPVQPAPTQSTQSSFPTGAPKGPHKLLTCSRTGLPLATITTVCSNGWPLLGHPTFNSMVHPVFGFPLDKLIVRFKKQLIDAEDVAFCLQEAELRELALSMSALMYSLDCIWIPATEAAYRQEPSLPCEAVVVGCGSRLLKLASWYHYATSKRLGFPLYRVSKANSNLGWENFRSWLDTAWEIKTEWEEGRDELAAEEELRARTIALHTVSAASVYKKIDLNKVWNWIDIQLAQDGRYPAGRRETFKTVFLRGDMSPEDWTRDDIEDIQLAIVECCDIGNEINFFINARLQAIKAIIEDFYSSFTLLNHAVGDVSSALDMSPQEQERSNEFFAGFDERASILTALPPAPKRESFASLGLFLKATAQHNILSKRYDMVKKAGKLAPVVPAAPVAMVTAIVESTTESTTTSTTTSSTFTQAGEL